MRSVVHTIIAALCILSLLDFSWVGLQAYAWAKMAQERIDDVSWSQAIIEAIGSDAPCEVCQYIQSERGKEKENRQATDVEASSRQPMSLGSNVRIRPAVLLGSISYFLSVESRANRAECPPVPPPEQA